MMMIVRTLPDFRWSQHQVPIRIEHHGRSSRALEDRLMQKVMIDDEQAYQGKAISRLQADRSQIPELLPITATSTSNKVIVDIRCHQLTQRFSDAYFRLSISSCRSWEARSVWVSGACSLI